ncbi:acyltransferase [Vulgatibacter incomptus]|uniref:Maltose O-acetyltransferase n=1 Tax=Vulgatibacter incomptus TaxID=1391653 RepID=A0A0K1PDG3_9BACT|nr:acyltransferase [Vulgatibacter incomptus]AKU91446.1 Maltose O-acetyltransferase [Vulgatibacter incomptus]
MSQRGFVVTSLGKLVDEPWYYFERAAAILRARALFRGATLGPRVGAKGRVDATLEGVCRLGARVTFRGGMIPTQLRVHRGGTLTVGEDAVVNYGVLIEVHDRVEIGARAMIASMSRICDRDGTRTGPVVIEDDVWIAHGALIQPGVHIGAGAVVSAGSVVTDDVPSRFMASGNPARMAPLALVRPSATCSNTVKPRN